MAINLDSFGLDAQQQANTLLTETKQDIAQLVSGLFAMRKDQDQALISELLDSNMSNMPAALATMSADFAKLAKNLGQATANVQNTELDQISAEIDKIKQAKPESQHTGPELRDLRQMAQLIPDLENALNSQTAVIQNLAKTISKEIGQQLAIDITSAQLPAVKVLDNLLPDIGQTVNDQLKEVNANVANAQSLGDMMQEIKTSFSTSLSQLVESLERKSNSSSEQLVPLLENLVRTGRDQVDVSTKILQSNY